MYSILNETITRLLAFGRSYVRPHCSLCRRFTRWLWHSKDTRFEVIKEPKTIVARSGRIKQQKGAL